MFIVLRIMLIIVVQIGGSSSEDNRSRDTSGLRNNELETGDDGC